VTTPILGTLHFPVNGPLRHVANRAESPVNDLGGSGLVGLKDRIEALGGTFSIHSPAAGGTTVSCELPVVTGAGQPDAGPSQ